MPGWGVLQKTNAQPSNASFNQPQVLMVLWNTSTITSLYK